MAADADGRTEAEVDRAFDSAYRRMGELTTRLEKAITHVQSMLELLLASGTLDEAEMRERLPVVAERVQEDFNKGRLYVAINAEHEDKYALEPQVDRHVDCENRLHLCQGACCRMWFPLSKQDLEEGIVRWDLHRPYANKKRADGRCVHQEEETLGCGVYDNRPAICRTYSCVGDWRIWLNFDDYVPNPDVLAHSDPGVDAKMATVAVDLGPTRRRI